MGALGHCRQRRGIATPGAEIGLLHAPDLSRACAGKVVSVELTDRRLWPVLEEIALS